MTDNELSQLMESILRKKGGQCTVKELLDAVQSIDKTVDRARIEDIITRNNKIFKRTNAIYKDGILLVDFGVKFANEEPLPKSESDNTIESLPNKVVKLPTNQNKRKKQ